MGTISSRSRSKMLNTHFNVVGGLSGRSNSYGATKVGGGLLTKMGALSAIAFAFCMDINSVLVPLMMVLICLSA